MLFHKGFYYIIQNQELPFGKFYWLVCFDIALRLISVSAYEGIF